MYPKIITISHVRQGASMQGKHTEKMINKKPAQKKTDYTRRKRQEARDQKAINFKEELEDNDK